MSNRDYCDLVYSWFQCESTADEEGNRIVNKSQVNYSHIGQQLGMDRRTVTRYVKKLVELGLLVEEGPGYTLQKLEPCAATLVPFVTLRQIQNALHKNSVSIFVYLLNRFIANKYEPFMVTYAELKKYIGISTATASNNVIIADILKVLQKLELIQYHIVYTEDKHAHLEILSVRNVI